MVICKVCFGYIKPSVELEKEMCQGCVDMGYYEVDSVVRYAPIDDTSLADKIRCEMEQSQCESV